MRCPFCKENRDKVIDSRSSDAGRVIRRRRQCLVCKRRFTTYEKTGESFKLYVVKKDNSRVPYDRDKIIAGLQKACYKREVSAEQIQQIADKVEEDVVLLCTDGVAPLGLPDAAANRPVLVVNGTNRPVSPSLAGYASRSGGAVVRLGTLEVDEALQRLSVYSPRIVSVKAPNMHSCHYEHEPSPGALVHISGRFHGNAPRSIRVNYGHGQAVYDTTTARMSDEGGTASAFPRRLWAQAALAD